MEDYRVGRNGGYGSKCWELPSLMNVGIYRDVEGRVVEGEMS